VPPPERCRPKITRWLRSRVTPMALIFADVFEPSPWRQTLVCLGAYFAQAVRDLRFGRARQTGPAIRSLPPRRSDARPPLQDECRTDEPMHGGRRVRGRLRHAVFVIELPPETAPIGRA
jgi:hypothetical protein